jgi:hypothetical protein
VDGRAWPLAARLTQWVAKSNDGWSDRGFGRDGVRDADDLFRDSDEWLHDRIGDFACDNSSYCQRCTDWEFEYRLRTIFR